jgi:hypothetical protein
MYEHCDTECNNYRFCRHCDKEYCVDHVNIYFDCDKCYKNIVCENCYFHCKLCKNNICYDCEVEDVCCTYCKSYLILYKNNTLYKIFPNEIIDMIVNWVRN